MRYAEGQYDGFWTLWLSSGLFLIIFRRLWILFLFLRLAILIEGPHEFTQSFWKIAYRKSLLQPSEYLIHCNLSSWENSEYSNKQNHHHHIIIIICFLFIEVNGQKVANLYYLPAVFPFSFLASSSQSSWWLLVPGWTILFWILLWVCFV